MCEYVGFFVSEYCILVDTIQGDENNSFGWRPNVSLFMRLVTMSLVRKDY